MIIALIPVFLIPFSLISLNFHGHALYPSFVLIPFGLYLITAQGHRIHFDGSCKVALLLLLTIFASSLIRNESQANLLKYCLGIFFILAIRRIIHDSPNLFWHTLDCAMATLVVFGAMQFAAHFNDQPTLVHILHDVIGYKGFGGPIDFRGGIVRVASLTKEPSYFAYATGIYIFLTHNPAVRILCVFGLLISFSLISLVFLIGLAAWWIWSKAGLGFLSFACSVSLAHFAFAYNIEMINETLAPTFHERYKAIVYMLHESSWHDWLLGVAEPLGSLYLYGAMSNLGSALVELGLTGWALIILAGSIFVANGHANAAAAWFLFSFNFHYLTSWPVTFTFIAVMSIKKRRFAETDAHTQPAAA